VLGTLVFDDGAAHPVDGGYLIGRMPDDDERVRTGELRPIVVDDQDGSVSPAHAEIRVSGWDVIVIDTGSRGGTYVTGPDEDSWAALPPRRSRRLLPGTRVRLGGRMFVFESSSTVR
jgi:predicted component of type VI protein secretion system